jgi:cyclohexa-1,5-dienecarbonyl-CoA hydratase
LIYGAGLDETERIYLEDLMRTRDAEEGIRAFLERRAPKWEDR